MGVDTPPASECAQAATRRGLDRHTSPTRSQDPPRGLQAPNTLFRGHACETYQDHHEVEGIGFVRECLKGGLLDLDEDASLQGTSAGTGHGLVGFVGGSCAAGQTHLGTEGRQESTVPAP